MQTHFGLPSLALAYVAFLLTGCALAVTPSAGPFVPSHGALARSDQVGDRGESCPPAGLNSAGRASPGTIYVSDPAENYIAIYPAQRRNPAPCGYITNGIQGPLGIALDREGTLYVANSTGSDVAEYKSGQTAPSIVIMQGIARPRDVTLGVDRTLYVSNAKDVTVYPRGATAPSQTITKPLRAPAGLALDASGNLFVADSILKDVIEFPKGSSYPFELGLLGLQAPAGVAFDRYDELLVSDSRSGTINGYVSLDPYPAFTLGSFSGPHFFGLRANGEIIVPNANAPHTVEEMRRRGGDPFSIITRGLKKPMGIAAMEF
jgi:hypothetical protein